MSTRWLAYILVCINIPTTTGDNQGQMKAKHRFLYYNVEKEFQFGSAIFLYTIGTLTQCLLKTIC